MYVSVNDFRLLKVGDGSVLHVGAHHGQERGAYRRLGWSPAFWIEALPEAVEVLRELVDPLTESVIAAACGSVDGDEVPFHVLGVTGERSSLLQPGGGGQHRGWTEI